MQIIKLNPLVQAFATVLVVSGLLSISSVTMAKKTPAGAVISNEVIVTYSDAKGKKFSNKSNRIEMKIREVRTSVLRSVNSKQTLPINTKQVKSIYMLENTGNIEDIYQLDFKNKEGDKLDAIKTVIYLDKNADGELSDEEIKQGVITQLILPMNGSASLIMISELPEGIVEADTLRISLEVENSKGKKPKGKGDVEAVFTAEELGTKLETVLTVAKSHCETGQLLSGETFADIRLNDMASGECVTLHIRAKNIGKTTAYKVLLKPVIPEYLSYIENSLRMCSDSEVCNLLPKTDSLKDKDNAAYDPNTGILMIGSDLMEIKTGAIIKVEYRVKID